MSEPLPDITPEVIDRVEAAAVADGSIAAESAPTNEVTPIPATPEGVADDAGATTEEVDSFTKFDPNALPEELRPVYGSLQGDYTRKMQEAAPWRKLGAELGVDDPNAIRQAVELYAHLQDETNLRSFAGQLANELGILGQPQTAATDIPQVGAEVDDLDVDSAALQPLRSEIEQLRSMLETNTAQAHAERLAMARAGEVARQEAFLAEQYPQWKQEDWNAVYDLSPAFDGDLVATANHLESFASARMASYLNAKQGVASTPGVSAPAPAAPAAVPREIDAEADQDLYAAGKEAAAYLRELLNASE